jgi:hypothetical protein
MSAELRAACAAMPKAHLTYVTTTSGKPRSKHGLGMDFAKWATAAGLPKRCRMHGLKKAGMRRGAEAGNTAHELMAQSGHRTLSEVQRYADAADRKRLADSGMAKRRAAQNANAAVTNLGASSYKTGKQVIEKSGVSEPPYIFGRNGSFSERAGSGIVLSEPFCQYSIKSTDRDRCACRR